VVGRTYGGFIDTKIRAGVGGVIEVVHKGGKEDPEKPKKSDVRPTISICERVALNWEPAAHELC
jgi:hypothetical protein